MGARDGSRRCVGSAVLRIALRAALNPLSDKGDASGVAAFEVGRQPWFVFFQKVARSGQDALRLSGGFPCGSVLDRVCLQVRSPHLGGSTEMCGSGLGGGTPAPLKALKARHLVGGVKGFDFQMALILVNAACFADSECQFNTTVGDRVRGEYR